MLVLLVHPRLRPGSKAAAEDPLSQVPALARTVYCLVDHHGLIRSITGNARRVLGEACDRAAELGLNMRELLQPDERIALENWLGTAWLPELPGPLLLATRGPDAGTRWLELNTPGRVGRGEQETLLVEIREVTERTAQSRELRTLAAALEGSADAIYLLDEKGRVEYVNGAFVRITGYTPDEVVGRAASLLASGRHRADFDARMWETLRGGDPFAAEVQNRHADGSLYTVDLVITPVVSEDGMRYVAVARDITARKELEREVEDLAYYDALTGLANHRLLRERSGQVLALARRHGSMAAMMHIDMHRLRTLNAQHGRGVGDEVLRLIADRLRQSLRESDTLARVGSDEFLVLLSEVADDDAVARVVRRLHLSISQPYAVQGQSIALASHIGLALFPRDADTFDGLLECAETAVRRAAQTALSFEFYERDLSIAAHDRMSLEDDMQWAWENGQFVLHYQPIIGADGQIVGAEALARGRVVGVEALARWPHLERGMLGPNEFIPLAEKSGRILSLDRWAIATAAKQAAVWAQQGWDGWISINLSGRTLQDPELPGYMTRMLSEHDLGRGRIAIEISEATAMRDPLATARVLDTLRDLGVLIAIDNFGVGHASLAYLKLFPVDLLKLDGGTVRGIDRGGREQQLIEIMISLAHRIGAKVVAEGVEADSQMEWLKAAGCDYIQGHLIGWPAPAHTAPPTAGGGAV
ncbi:MAG: EAL domain-containing protein [Gemmatimonadota bacterium]